MGFLKFLGKFFGGFLIVLALTVFFTGLSLNYALSNTDVMVESAKTNIPKILQENREEFAKVLLKDQRITMAQVKETCLKDPKELTEEFCEKLKTMKTEEEMKNELVDVAILKTREQFFPEIQQFEQDLRSKITESPVSRLLNYTLPLSLFIFLLGSLLILLAEKFKWKYAMFAISLKTMIFSAFTSVSSYFVRNMTSESFENMLKVLPMMQGEEGDSIAVKLMSALMTNWINVVVMKVFIVSVLITLVSLSIAIMMFVLKREKKAVEKPEKETLEKKLEPKKKISKKKSKK